MKSRRRPKMSASRPPRSRAPPNRIAYALITHWRFSSAKCRSVLIAGRATFTMAISSTTMNCAATTTASASHFRREVCAVIEACVIYCSNESLLSATIAHINAWTRYTSIR